MLLRRQSLLHVQSERTVRIHVPPFQRRECPGGQPRCGGLATLARSALAEAVYLVAFSSSLGTNTFFELGL
jgi:hypothetical protein